MKKTSTYYGWMGRIAEVDLTEGKVRIAALDREVAEKYLGGRGFNIKVLFDRVGLATEPLEPENLLIFSAGLLIGTGFPVANRCVVSSKSPLSYYGMSLVGGYFGAELKRSGFDSIIIRGCSREPSQIIIQDGEIRIEDAQGLWGLGTHETQRRIHSQLGKKFRIACIGTAGEKMARIAGIIFDQRAGGRGGIGAVMGSKNLKSIAVRGTQAVSVHGLQSTKIILRKLREEIKKRPGPRQDFPKYGTLGAIETIHRLGLFPSRNFQKGLTDHIRDIGLEGLLPFIDKKPVACFNCPVRCTNAFKIEDNHPVATHGPEYESVAAFGGMCGILDPATIIRANYLCNDLGLDTISTGSTLSFVMECLERGLVSHSEIGLWNLAFGKSEPFLEAIQAIGLRKDKFTYLMGEGTKRLSAQIGQGSHRFAHHVKGLEIAMYEPRASTGMALVFAVANRGGCHHSQGYPLREEISSGTLFEYTGKGKLVRNLAQSRILSDSSTYCSFLTETVHWGLPEVLSTSTGSDFSWERLKEISDRINNLERLFVLREGCTPEEDKLPERFFDEPLPDGPAKGSKLDKSAFNEMRREYYENCGWGQDGVPTEETLTKVGLSVHS
jgi:aldehyde:ferredoxin oxidoreductase